MISPSLEPLALTPADKEKATLRAQLAMRGIELRELSDGSFIATRWNLCRALQTLEAVAAFARQTGAIA